MLGGYRRTVARLERKHGVELWQQPFVQEIGELGCPGMHLAAMLEMLERTDHNLPVLFQKELSLREVQELCEEALGKPGLLTDKGWVDELLNDLSLRE